MNPGGGFLTLFPQGVTRPLVANSNFPAGVTMNAPFTVGLGGTGEFMLYANNGTDIVIDVLGYYSPEANDVNGQGLLFNPLPSPTRLLDTRATATTGCDLPGAALAAGSTRTQSARGYCTIPVTAQGIVGNVTTVLPPGNGFLTFYPSTAMLPLASTSNFRANQVFNRHYTVGLGSGDGAFKIFTNNLTELVVDVSGYFAP